MTSWYENEAASESSVAGERGLILVRFITLRETFCPFIEAFDIARDL